MRARTAKGQSSPSTPFRLGSALPSHSCRGCCAAVEDESVPLTAVSKCSNVRLRNCGYSITSSAGEQRWRNSQAERLGGLEINDKIKIGWLLHWQISGR